MQIKIQHNIMSGVSPFSRLVKYTGFSFVGGGGVK